MKRFVWFQEGGRQYRKPILIQNIEDLMTSRGHKSDLFIRPRSVSSYEYSTSRTTYFKLLLVPPARDFYWVIIVVAKIVVA